MLTVYLRFNALRLKDLSQAKFQLGKVKDDFFIILLPIMFAENTVNYDTS
jgi:hypothetical protein